MGLSQTTENTPRVQNSSIPPDRTLFLLSLRRRLGSSQPPGGLLTASDHASLGNVGLTDLWLGTCSVAFITSSLNKSQILKDCFPMCLPMQWFSGGEGVEGNLLGRRNVYKSSGGLSHCKYPRSPQPFRPSHG